MVFIHNQTFVETSLTNEVLHARSLFDGISMFSAPVVRIFSAPLLSSRLGSVKRMGTQRRKLLEPLFTFALSSILAPVEDATVTAAVAADQKHKSSHQQDEGDNARQLPSIVVHVPDGLERLVTGLRAGAGTTLVANKNLGARHACHHPG